MKHYVLLFFSDKVDAGLVLPSTGIPRSGHQKIAENQQIWTVLNRFYWLQKCAQACSSLWNQLRFQFLSKIRWGSNFVPKIKPEACPDYRFLRDFSSPRFSRISSLGPQWRWNSNPPATRSIFQGQASSTLSLDRKAEQAACSIYFQGYHIKFARQHYDHSLRSEGRSNINGNPD